MSNAELSTILEPVVARHGLELDEVEVIPAGRRSVVRITVDGDGPKGRGPMMDDIAAATLAISEALDAADPLPGAYTLEVSSRGVSTPLTQPQHYRRNLTRLVKVSLADGTQLVGRICAVDGDRVTLEVTPPSVKGNRNPKPEIHELGLDEITKAIIQVEMNRSNADQDELDDDDSGEDEADGEDADDVDADDLDADDADSGDADSGEGDLDLEDPEDHGSSARG